MMSFLAGAPQQASRGYTRWLPHRRKRRQDDGERRNRCAGEESIGVDFFFFFFSFFFFFFFFFFLFFFLFFFFFPRWSRAIRAAGPNGGWVHLRARDQYAGGGIRCFQQSTAPMYDAPRAAFW